MFERRRGLPIGNLTSQFFSNLYLTAWTTSARRCCARRDTCATWTISRCFMTIIVRSMAGGDESNVPAGRRLRLHPRKTGVVPTTEPAQFLGFVLLPGGYRRLPDENVRRFRNRLRGLRDRWRAGAVTRAAVDGRVRAWIAHAEHAGSFRLRQAIFRRGWYDPSPGGA